MQLNDAHIFCQPEQVGAEVGAVLDLIERAYAAVGITAHRNRLSARGSTDKYVDDAAMWDLGEQALADVLDKRGLAYDAAPARALSTARRSTFRSWTKQAASQPCRLFSSTSISPGSST